MAEKLDKFYTEVLEYFGAEPNNEGVICSIEKTENGKSVEVTLNESGKRLLMPTKEGMSKYDAEKTVIFHPLREYIDRGESEVVKKLRTFFNIRVNIALFSVMSGLVTIAASPKLHSKLTPEQRDLLIGLPELKSDSGQVLITAFSKIWKTGTTTPFVSLFLKKAGRYKNAAHARVGVVNLTFRENLARAYEDKPMRQADAEAFPLILEHIFQGYIVDSEAYNSFSDSKDFPWFDCLLRTGYVITSRINEVIDLFEDFLPEEAKEVRFPHGWLETLDDIGSLSKEIAMVPVQRGNEGKIESKVTTKSSAAPTPEPRRESRDDDRGRDSRHDSRDSRDYRDDDRGRGRDDRDDRRDADSGKDEPETGYIDFDELMSRSRALQEARYARGPIADYIDNNSRGRRDSYERDPRRDPRDYRDYRDDPRGRDPRDDYRYDSRRDPRDFRDPRDDYRRDTRDYRDEYRRDPRDYRDDPRDFRDPRLDSRFEPRREDVRSGGRRPIGSPLYR